MAGAAAAQHNQECGSLLPRFSSADVLGSNALKTFEVTMDEQDVNRPEPDLLDSPGRQGEVIPMARPIGLEPEPLWLPPPRPRVWTVIVTCVVALVTYMLTAIIYVAVFHPLPKGVRVSPAELERQLTSDPSVVLSMFIWSMLAIMCVTLIAAFISPVSWRKRLRLRAPSLAAGQVVTGAIGATMIGTIFSMLAALDCIPTSPVLESLGEMVASMSGEQLLLSLLVIGMMPGISEELLFRGYVQTRFTQRWGVVVSVVLTSIMFGAYHMDAVQGTFAAVMGLYLGAIAERAGSIVPAMIAHAANNTFGVLFSVATGDYEDPTWCWILLIAAIVILIACVFHVWVAKRPSPPDSGDLVV